MLGRRSSRLGPIVPCEPAALSVWHDAQPALAKIALPPVGLPALPPVVVGVVVVAWVVVAAVVVAAVVDSPVVDWLPVATVTVFVSSPPELPLTPPPQPAARNT